MGLTNNLVDHSWMNQNVEPFKAHFWDLSQLRVRPTWRLYGDAPILNFWSKTYNIGRTIRNRYQHQIDAIQNKIFRILNELRLSRGWHPMKVINDNRSLAVDKKLKDSKPSGIRSYLWRILYSDGVVEVVD